MGQLSGVGAPRTTSSPTPTAAGTVVRATGVPVNHPLAWWIDRGGSWLPLVVGIYADEANLPRDAGHGAHAWMATPGSLVRNDGGEDAPRWEPVSPITQTDQPAPTVPETAKLGATYQDLTDLATRYVFDGEAWSASSPPPPPFDGVASLNGETGDVTLDFKAPGTTTVAGYNLSGLDTDFNDRLTFSSITGGTDATIGTSGYMADDSLVIAEAGLYIVTVDVLLATSSDDIWAFRLSGGGGAFAGWGGDFTFVGVPIPIFAGGDTHVRSSRVSIELLKYLAAGAKLHFNALIDTAGGANDASISGGITLQRLELVTAS